MPNVKPLTNLLGKAISEAAEKVPSIGGKALPEAGSLLSAVRSSVPTVAPDLGVPSQLSAMSNKLKAERSVLGDLYDSKYDFVPGGLDYLKRNLDEVKKSNPQLLANNFFNKDPLSQTASHPEWSDRFNKLFMKLQPEDGARHVAIGPNAKAGDIDIHDLYKDKPADFWAKTFGDDVNWLENVQRSDNKVSHGGIPLDLLSDRQFKAIHTGDMGDIHTADTLSRILGQHHDKQLSSNVVNNMERMVAYNRYNEMPENIQQYANALSNYYGKAMPSQAMGVSVSTHPGKTNTLIPQYMYDVNVNKLLAADTKPGVTKIDSLEELRPFSEGKISIRATDDPDRQSPAYTLNVANKYDDSVRAPHIGGFDSTISPGDVVAKMQEAPDIAKKKWHDAAMTKDLARKLPSDDFLYSRINDYPAHNDLTYTTMDNRYKGASGTVLHEALHAMNPPNLTRLIINNNDTRSAPIQSGFKNKLSYIGMDQAELLRGFSMNKLPILSELMQEAPGIMKKHFSDVPENIRQQAMEELITRAALNPDVILSRYNRYGILPNRQYRFGKKDNNTIRIPEQYMTFSPGVLQEIARSTTGVNRSALGPRHGAKGDTDAVATLKRLTPQLFGIAGAVPATTFMLDQAQKEDSAQ